MNLPDEPLDVAGLIEAHGNFQGFALDRLSLGVAIIGDSGAVVYANPAYQTLISKVHDDESPGLDTQAQDLAQQCLEKQSEIHTETKFGPSGGRSFYRLHAETMTELDFAAALVTIDDITRVKRLERIRRDFTTNISHELKTPLASIKGYLETLQDGALSNAEQALRFLGIMSRNVARIEKLIADLLHLSKIESADNYLSFHALDLYRTVRSAAVRHEGHLHAKSHQLSVSGPETPVTIISDREALTQVIDNLLDNAIKYTPQAGEISIAVTDHKDEGCLTIKDNGIGVDPKFHERIFQRFYRIDKQGSRSESGTGLGLAIVRHLITQLGGRIEVESAVGKGSQFRVWLPKQPQSSKK